MNSTRKREKILGRKRRRRRKTRTSKQYQSLFTSN